jgi:protocatechuate 3,4-dioxygenase beta subunit
MDDDLSKTTLLSNNPLTRRQTLTALATAGATVLPMSAQAQPAAVVSRLLPGAHVCILNPREEDGPFYFDPKLDRVDITEGKTGVPLGLLVQIVEARDCSPLKGARVDVWHADALGIYSGYPGQGDARDISTKDQHFMRGSQVSNDDGQVSFATVYPGWYKGRTAHIHVKVWLDDKTVLTTQIYFPDALSEFIYRNVKPYNNRRHERDTSNTTDYVLNKGGNDRTSFCSIKEEADRYLASLVIGVDRDANETSQTPPPPPPPSAMASPPHPASKPRFTLIPGPVASSR